MRFRCIAVADCSFQLIMRFVVHVRRLRLVGAGCRFHSSSTTNGVTCEWHTAGWYQQSMLQEACKTGSTSVMFLEGYVLRHDCVYIVG